MAQRDVIQLPVTRFDGLSADELLLALTRNFQEIQIQLNTLQRYEKATGKPINEQVETDSPVWNRAENINEDGTFPSEQLTDKMVGLDHELQLADEAVTAAKIAVGAIETPHIGDGQITDTKLAAGAITEAKLNWQTHLLY
jgi:hypothetical protein